jgi:hypothetical protein
LWLNELEGREDENIQQAECREKVRKRKSVKVGEWNRHMVRAERPPPISVVDLLKREVSLDFLIFLKGIYIYIYICHILIECVYFYLF